MIYSFEKLLAWQESRSLVKDIYILINKYPKCEQYALCDQLRRASISIPSNIAEGNTRTSSKERMHFIDIAYGSLMEVYCQLILSKDLEYINGNELSKMRTQIDRVSKLLSGLKTSLQK
ncbi:MAG: four helix bundle protein [Bacteroidales bacterium]|nr:four helix bundle protein [Bacteroidales bacterium]